MLTDNRQTAGCEPELLTGLGFIMHYVLHTEHQKLVTPQSVESSVSSVEKFCRKLVS